MSRSGFATIIQFTSEPCAVVNGCRNNGQRAGSDGIETNAQRRAKCTLLSPFFFSRSFFFFFFLFRFCSADFARLQRLVTCELGMYFQNYKIPPRATLIITFVRLGCLGRVFEVLFWKSSKTFDERFLFSEMSSNLQSLRIFFLIFSK